MMNKNSFSNKEKSNHLIQVKVPASEKERLCILAEQAGFNTLSSFIRFQCLQPSFDMKLNKILRILEKEEERGKNEERGSGKVQKL